MLYFEPLFMVITYFADSQLKQELNNLETYTVSGPVPSVEFYLRL